MQFLLESVWCFFSNFANSCQPWFCYSWFLFLVTLSIYLASTMHCFSTWQRSSTLTNIVTAEYLNNNCSSPEIDAYFVIVIRIASLMCTDLLREVGFVCIRYHQGNCLLQSDTEGWQKCHNL